MSGRGTSLPDDVGDTGRLAGPPPDWMYDLITVEEVVLTEVVSLHPKHLTARGIFQNIAVDSNDPREKEVVSLAIRNLREFSLLRGGDGVVVKPTEAALRAGLLFMGRISEAHGSDRESPAESDSSAPAQPGGLDP